jgi:hypothetical protein
MEIQEMTEVLSKAKKNEKGEYINVECRSKRDIDGDWEVVPSPVWDFPSLDYRIKPEPRRVPLTEQDLIERIEKNQTLWIRDGNPNNKFKDLILKFGVECVYTYSNRISYDILKERFNWLDGKPCSKESECG